MNALHIIAHALSIEPSQGGCLCSFCGNSPFGAVPGALAKINVAVVASRADARSDDVCAGCVAIMAGKPGSDPPPLRTRNVLLVDGEIFSPPLGDLRVLLSNPPLSPFVVSWATSRKKHHAMSAGVSTPHHQVWGSDSGPIDVYPAEHEPVVSAIESLLSWHRRADIENGTYSAPAIQRQGASAWVSLEDRIASYRGQRCWPLLIALARKPEGKPAPPDESLGPLFGGHEVRDPIDEMAADMIAGVARASARRGEDGIGFWGGYLRSRIERHAHRPLREFMSRLIDECGASTTSDAVASVLARLDSIGESQAAAVGRALRTRAALIVAMTYDRTRKDGSRTEIPIA